LKRGCAPITNQLRNKDMNTEKSNKTPSRTKQKSTRNFGIGSRDMTRAGKLFVHGSLHSFSTRGTVADRWQLFAGWAKDELGITKMEHITPDVLIKYGGYLKIRIDSVSCRHPPPNFMFPLSTPS